MKTIPAEYQCEICGDRSKEKSKALECEAKGLDFAYPVGMIFGNHTKEAMYNGITFAIAKIAYCGHLNDSALWACRDNGAGDSVGKEMCGNGGFLHFNEYQAHLDFNDPTFKRMVKFLNKSKIPITIWDGKKVVKYKGK